MMSSASPIREQFTLQLNRIVRELSIDSLSGQSTVSLDNKRLSDGAPPDLRSAWDKRFLMGSVEFPPAPQPKDVVRIGDVFCGAGGLSYGVHDAVRACGLLPKSILAIDVDDVALEVYRRNFDPEYYSTQNLWTSVTTSYSARMSRIAFLSKPTLLTKELSAASGQIDLLLGGPPCEGHSTSNNLTRRSDPRNAYYVIMPALAVALKARAVIVENVPGIEHDSRSILEQSKALFKSVGYHIDESVVNTLDVGLPQTRKRHILIASKTRRPAIDEAVRRIARPVRSLRWAIGDLEHVNSNDLFDTPADHSDVNRLRIDYLFDNNEYNLPNEHRPDSHKGGHTYPSIYGRLHWDKPSGTITTGFNTPGRGRYIHPDRRSTITPHEAARIQGFPDSFEFKLIDGHTPTRTSLANMIGDAVPPQIGYAAGIAALETLAHELAQLSGCTAR